MFLYGLPQSRSHYVGINLRRRDVSMSQHHLHTTQVGATLQQMSGEAVTKYVRRQAAKDSGFFPIAGQQVPECLPGETASPGSDKKILAGTSLEQLGTAV